MARRTIEIDDVLPDCVNTAIEQTKEALEEFIESNPDQDQTPCLSNDLDYSGRIHEIVDSAVPIYYSQIEAAWYLHGNELESAYEDAGVGNNPRENHGMAAIYFYIHQKVAEWYDQNADSLFEECLNWTRQE